MSPCPFSGQKAEDCGWICQGDDLLDLFNWAKENKFAIPAVNCVSSSSINSVLEAAKVSQNPVIIQISQGGGAFYCGKGIKDTDYQATIAGSVSLALHTRTVAPLYKVPVVIHSDHCAKKLLPWFDGMLEADANYARANGGKPLFCSHMLDLSEETDDENITTCVDRFTKMQKDGMKQWLEMEIGITGGEEDGVDNSNVDPEKLMTTPAQIHAVYSALSPIAPYFSIAAAFGNVHGVYKPGNVVLNPTILGKHQAYVGEKTGKATPLYLVFHGGSGSTKQEIKTAVSNGVVKMNIDTDTQWAYWTGLRDYFFKNWDSLMLQVGVVSVGGDPDKPNKKKFDPRVWLRAAEETLVARVKLAYEELGAVSTLTLT